jgi:hypothetical protein
LQGQLPSLLLPLLLLLLPLLLLLLLLPLLLLLLLLLLLPFTVQPQCYGVPCHITSCLWPPLLPRSTHYNPT